MDFWDKVEHGEPGGCWPWIGGPLSRGYGQTYIDGMALTAHRAAFYIQHGWLPPVVDHQCHNQDPGCSGGITCEHRRCCNPAHLAASTHRENLLASPLTAASKQAAKTHCPQGHEYTDENTYSHRGSRSCKECRRRHSREYHRRRRSEGLT